MDKSPLCKNHVVHWNMSDCVSGIVTSPFPETDSSTGEAITTPLHPPLYLNSLTEIVVQEEVATKVIRECSQARGKSRDEEELTNVVGGVLALVRTGAESEGLSFVDALRRAKLTAASNLETVIDTSRTFTCK